MNDNNLTSQDVNNVLTFDANTPVTSATTQATVATNGTGLLNTPTAVCFGDTSTNYSYYGNLFYNQLMIRQVANGYVVEHKNSSYVAKNMNEVTKVLNGIFNLKKGNKNGKK